MSEETRVYIEYEVGGHHVNVSGLSAANALSELETILNSHLFGGKAAPQLSIPVGVETADEEAQKAEEPPKPARKKRASKKKAAAATAAEPETATEPAGDDPWGDDAPKTDAADTPITVQDIRERILPLGRERGMSVLRQFNAGKLSDLTFEQYPEVMQAIEKAEAE